MRLLAIAAAAALSTSFAEPATGCRFWALVGEGYPQEMISDHLRTGSPNLQGLSLVHADGWGIGCYPAGGGLSLLNRPLIRRGGPPANHPSFREFEVAAEELSAIAPRAAIAHVRKCTISHCGVPDPHPFQRDGILFAHNGRMSDSLMVELLTASDPDYLEEHPPEYVDDYIDSELYFLYLRKYADDHPELSLPEALQAAVADLAPLTATRLNFVLSTGDTLLALRHAQNDLNDPVVYYPAGGSPSPYWVVASQSLGSDPLRWMAIPPRTLALFVPNEMPQFFPIDSDTTASLEGMPPAGATPPLPRPNPARSGVTIPVFVPTGGAPVEIEVFDANGRRVWWKVHSRVDSGMKEFLWDGAALDGRESPSGTYFCTIRAGGERRNLRVNLVR